MTVTVNAETNGLERLAKALANGSDAIATRVAEEARNVAEFEFGAVVDYPGVNDTVCTVESADGASTVIASGASAPYIEFGFGIAMNPGGGNYPIFPNPAGIDDIGEHSPVGNIPSAGASGAPFRFYDVAAGMALTPTDGKTLGFPAAMPMYKALQYARDNAAEIVQEVLENG